MRNPTRFALVLVAVLASCDDPLLPKPELVIRTTSASVSIKNMSDDEPLFSMVYDPNGASQPDWAACVEDGCGRIAPRAVRTVTAAEIYSGPGHEILVYTWRRIGSGTTVAIAGPVTIHRVRLIQPFPQ